jgi:hypothetical protein
MKRIIRRTGVARGAQAGLLLAAAAGLLLAGCFFDPREAEPPDGGGDVSEPAKSQEEVRDKLKDCFEKFSWQQYQLLLATDVHFAPDRADSSELADAGHFPFAEPWGFAREEDVFNRILSCFNNFQTKAGGMILTYKGEQLFTDSSVTGYSTFESDYHVTISYATLVAPTREDSLPLDGSLKLYIRNETGAYRIYRWEDYRKGALPTWGRYKGDVASSLSYCPD